MMPPNRTLDLPTACRSSSPKARSLLLCAHGRRISRRAGQLSGDVMTSAISTTRMTRRIHVTDSRSTWQRLDWLIVVSTAALLVAGSLLVWSATASNEALTGGNGSFYLVKHVINVTIGLVLAALIAATDHRWVRIWAPVVYLGGVLGLVVVLSPLGAVINGSRSWILIGSMSIQPAELAKLGVVAGMALLLAERTEARRTAATLRGWDVGGALAIAAVPSALILAQPDLGTLLVLGRRCSDCWPSRGLHADGWWACW